MATYRTAANAYAIVSLSRGPTGGAINNASAVTGQELGGPQLYEAPVVTQWQVELPDVGLTTDQALTATSTTTASITATFVPGAPAVTPDLVMQPMRLG